MDEKDQENGQEQDQEQAPGNFPVAFGERKIMFKQPTEGQIAVIARGVRKAERGGAGTVTAIGLILDVLDKLVVEIEDRNWLEDGLIDGSVRLNDFIGVLDGINQVDDDEVVGRPSTVKTARARSGRR